MDSEEAWDIEPRLQGEWAIRALNVSVAALAIVLMAPVMLLTALAVRLTSRGPILYTQPRIGLDRRWRQEHRATSRRGTDLGGRVFRIYKFRTMRVDAEQQSGAVWAQKRDARVTPIGEFLRKSRLDELPQLINVLKGDMNIVGPRPERPSIFLRLSDEIHGYPVRQRARPGITGWAQINQAYDTCVDDVRRKVAYDLEYLQRQSLWEDLKIMVMTIPVMIGRKLGW
ncbi:MAG: sugar transferase [Gemmatimonadaceae bacterium]|nr:sugar transferase [Gemmatimonadaceae bacterium]